MGEVLGLVGTNGIGKSTALNILAGKLKPNLGKYDVKKHLELRNNLIHFNIFFLKNQPDWTDIIAHFRGSTLQSYFTKMVEDNLKTVIKPQYIDQIPKVVKVRIQ